MTTTTKRPDGGELHREARQSIPSDGFNCVYLYENGREVGCLNGPQDDPEVMERAKAWERSGSTPTNESPAPQAVAWYCEFPNYGHLTMKETEADDARLQGADVRPLVYANISDEARSPAPQPPVEGLRAIADYLYEETTKLDAPISMTACLALAKRCAALASPSLTAGADSGLRRAWLDKLNAIAPAVENLAGHQEQCDFDGVMVKVSRQALDQVLNAVNDLAVSFVTAPATLIEQSKD